MSRPPVIPNAFNSSTPDAWCWDQGPFVDQILSRCTRPKGHGGRHHETDQHGHLFAVWGEDVHRTRRQISRHIRKFYSAGAPLADWFAEARRLETARDWQGAGE